MDSPLDLVHLYDCSKRDLTKTTFPEYKDEARMVVALLDSTLGSATDSMRINYQRSAPLLNTAASASPLKDLPVRFYTEPDTGWWRRQPRRQLRGTQRLCLEAHPRYAGGGGERSC